MKPSSLPASSRSNNAPAPDDTDAGKFFDASSEDFSSRRSVPVFKNNEEYENWKFFDASDDESWLLPPVEKEGKENVARPVPATMTAGRRIARPIAPRMARRRAIAVAAAKNPAPPAKQSSVSQQQPVSQQPPVAQQMSAPPPQMPPKTVIADTDVLMPSVVRHQVQSSVRTLGSFSVSSVPFCGTSAVVGSVIDDPMEIDGPEFQAIDSPGDPMIVDLFRPAMAREVARLFGFSGRGSVSPFGSKKPTRLSCRLDVRSVRCGSLVGGSSWTAKMAVRRRSRLASRHKVGSSSRRVVSCAGRKT